MSLGKPASTRPFRLSGSLARPATWQARMEPSTEEPESSVLGGWRSFLRGPSGIGFLRAQRWVLLAAIAILAVTAVLETSMGRSALGPDGRFGWWAGDIWSGENSQRVLDVYSFSHIVHGVLFYAFLWLTARRLPLRLRLVMALSLAAGWEILENSQPIIERYRAGTQGYVGDSILNSCSDILMMTIGFLCASRLRVRSSVAGVLVLELFCLFWARENLTLSVIRVLHPVPAIQEWQSAPAPRALSNLSRGSDRRPRRAPACRYPPGWSAASESPGRRPLRG